MYALNVESRKYNKVQNNHTFHYIIVHYPERLAIVRKPFLKTEICSTGIHREATF